MRWWTLMALASLVGSAGCSTTRPLFNGRDLTGWVEVGSTGAWVVDDGVLRCTGQKDDYAWLSTADKYADFVLMLDWRVPEGGNTGVFLRAPDREGRTSMKGFEVQIKDDSAEQDLADVSGAVFSRIPAGAKFARPVGEWNSYRITMDGRHLLIELNGHIVSETDIDTIESMQSVPDEGYIGLQNHGQAAEFKDIRIKLLE